MRLDGPANTRKMARRLRRAMTPPEIGLWLALRRNDAAVRFRRQHPAGAYVLDFYWAPARLAIEIDGEAHDRADRPARDAARTAWLESQGVEVLRFLAIEVLRDCDAVVRQIIAIAVARHRELGSRSPTAPSVSR